MGEEETGSTVAEVTQGWRGLQECGGYPRIPGKLLGLTKGSDVIRL